MHPAKRVPRAQPAQPAGPPQAARTHSSSSAPPRRGPGSSEHEGLELQSSRVTKAGGVCAVTLGVAASQPLSYDTAGVSAAPSRLTSGYR